MTELKPCPFCGGEAAYIGTDQPIKRLESVVQWNSYCVDMPALPKSGRWAIVKFNSGGYLAGIVDEDISWGRYATHGELPEAGIVLIKIGFNDRWAYLPEPPRDV